MFNINDWIYYRPGKGKRKERCKIIGVTYDLVNFRYILETKYEKIIEGVSIIDLSTW